MRASILVLLVFCSFYGYTNCRRTFSFHFKSIQCFSNPKYMALFECSVRDVNLATTLSMNITLAEDIKKLTYDLLVMLPAARKNLILFDMNRLDGCGFLENKSAFPLLQIIRKEFAKHSNIPNKCPVSKGTSVKVRGLKLDPENFPSYVPETKFFVRVRMYENGGVFFNLTVNGTCENIRKFYKG